MKIKVAAIELIYSRFYIGTHFDVRWSFTARTSSKNEPESLIPACYMYQAHTGRKITAVQYYIEVQGVQLWHEAS